jgi:hypothetical protein
MTDTITTTKRSATEAIFNDAPIKKIRAAPSPLGFSLLAYKTYMAASYKDTTGAGFIRVLVNMVQFTADHKATMTFKEGTELAEYIGEHENDHYGTDEGNSDDELEDDEEMVGGGEDGGLRGLKNLIAPLIEAGALPDGFTYKYDTEDGIAISNGCGITVSYNCENLNYFKLEHGIEEEDEDE